MQRLSVRHTTTYSYATTVQFGEHRLMVRPRDSHDLRLHEATLVIEPQANLRWIYDVFGNSVALARFPEPAEMLRFISEIIIDRYPYPSVDFGIEPYATKLPFSYPASEISDLGRTIERHYSDADRTVADWTRKILGDPSVANMTEAFLHKLSRNIRNDFQYVPRHEHGVQSPEETLRNRSGSCRDYALLMMEAARAVGLAARFVTGYLYDPSIDGLDNGATGAGSTHAWVQIYLPGPGWLEFDPTNGGAGGHNLVPVAVAREPSQAVPVSGTFVGASNDYLGLDVSVEVRTINTHEKRS